MRILGVLLAVMLTLPATSFAEGNATGNGGGVICIAGKCQTLIEAGLRLSPEFEGVWLPESEHYSKVEAALNSRLFLGNKVVENIYYTIFARADHFRAVEVIDETKLESIKKLYMEVAASSGFPLDPATFKVVAFSSDNTVEPAMTYLLPAFFQLSIDAQVDILIHEGLYRSKPSNFLKYILQLESAMHAFKDSKHGTGACNVASGELLKTCVNQQIIGYRLGFISKGDLVGAMLRFAAGDGIVKHVSSSLFGEIKKRNRI